MWPAANSTLSAGGADQGWAGLHRPGLGGGMLWTVSSRAGVGAQGRQSDWKSRFFP